MAVATLDQEHGALTGDTTSTSNGSEASDVSGEAKLSDATSAAIAAVSTLPADASPAPVATDEIDADAGGRLDRDRDAPAAPPDASASTDPPAAASPQLAEDAQPTDAVASESGPLAPEFYSTTWLNSEPLTMAGLRGKVVMVDFWTFG